MPILNAARRRRPLRVWTSGVAAIVVGCAAPGLREPPTVAAPRPAQAPAAATAAPLPQARQNRVALLVPMSGANAAVGQSIANAANLALLDVGERRINLRVYDTAPGAAAAANRALGEGAGLFLGPLLASDARIVQPLAAARNVPVVSFSNDSSLAGAGVLVMGFQPGQSIARVVGHARAAGLSRFAALVPAGAYGQRASQAFLRGVQASGGQVLSIATYTRDPVRMTTAARTVTAYDARVARGKGKAVVRPDGSVAPGTTRLPPVGFQALLIADSGTVANGFAPALAKFGAPPGSMVVLGTELWNNEPALRGARGLEGALFASVPDGRFNQMAQRYRARFGGAPSRLASFGYDGVLLVNNLAGRWRLDEPFPRVLLTSPEGFVGVDGAFRFNADGIAERALEVQRIGGGAITTVSAARGFGG